MVMGYGLPTEFVFSGVVLSYKITSYCHHVLHIFQSLLPYALA